MQYLLFLTLPLAALALPQPDTRHLSIREDFFPYVIEDVCHTADSRFDHVKRFEKMLHAVQSARGMVKLALKEWWDEGKHGEAAATYLAIPNNGRYKQNEFAQRVKANLQNVALLDERLPFLSRFINVQCTDIEDKCNRDVEGRNKPIGGYANNTYHFLGGWHYDIVLCQPFFFSDTPTHLAKFWPTQDNFLKVALNFLENDAGRMLHEMMHINLITADRPHIVDQLYDGKRVYTAPIVADWVLNYKARPADVVQNADCYTQFVNEPVTALDESLECYNGGSEYVHKGQDKHIEVFCTKVADEYVPGSSGEIALQFNEDTPEQMQFRFGRATRGKILTNEIKAQCTTSMSKLFHSCDTKSAWKHGGAYTFSEGKDNKRVDVYTYFMDPKHARPDPPPARLPSSCDVWYKFLGGYDEFFVSGGLWAVTIRARAGCCRTFGGVVR